MSGKSLEDDLLKKNMILVMVLMSGKGLEDDLLKKKYDFGHGVGCLVKDDLLFFDELYHSSKRFHW